MQFKQFYLPVCLYCATGDKPGALYTGSKSSPWADTQSTTSMFIKQMKILKFGLS